MYNRYIRNDQGVYTCITEDDAPPRDAPGAPPEAPPNPGEIPPSPPPEGRAREDPASRALRGVLDRLHLESVDTGDLLLLAILFLLFREDADEELLLALGLLLIL
jgi:hypothetical protein